jgi:hypothetical protein
MSLTGPQVPVIFDPVTEPAQAPPAPLPEKRPVEAPEPDKVPAGA